MDFLAVSDTWVRGIDFVGSGGRKRVYMLRGSYEIKMCCDLARGSGCVIRGGGIEDVGQVVAMPPSSRPERVRVSWSSEVLPGWFGR